MADFYLLDSSLTVPEEFWDDDTVVVHGTHLMFAGDGDVTVTRLDTFTQNEWVMERDLWRLAAVADGGELLVLVVGDEWYLDGPPDLYLWRVTPGKLEQASALEVKWKPWEPETPTEDITHWMAHVALARKAPLSLVDVKQFSPTAYRLPEDWADAIRMLTRPYVPLTDDAFAFLDAQGVDIFRTQEGLLVTIGALRGTKAVMPLRLDAQQEIERQEEEGSD